VPDEDAATRARLCEAIVRHLRQHAQAADTAEGIVLNWLPGFADAPRHIDAVLKRMTEKRLLSAHALPGGKLLYRKGEAAG
jgi:hypothetical protein